MSKGLEKIYNTQEITKEKEEIPTKIEIPKNEWKTLVIIAQRVGGDFGMKVKLGKPREGSFFNPEDASITFDPLQVQGNPELAKLIAGHEGSHRAITPSPTEMGLSPEKIRELYSQIGFGYLQNVIEDPAVNDWMRKRFPGLGPCVKDSYDEQFRKENTILYAVIPGSEEARKVNNFRITHGYWPRFIQWGSEVIRDWHQKRFSKNLDPAVKKALERVIKYAREDIGIIPDPQKIKRDRKEIIVAGQKRFENNLDYVWPEVKKLVDMDLHTEAQRQMLQDFRQKQKELKQKQQEMKQAQKEGNSKKQKELQKEIKKLREELDPFNKLPKGVKEELRKQIDKAVQEASKKLNDEIKEQKKQMEEAKRKQEGLEKDMKDLEEKAKSAKGKERKDLEKQIQKKKLQSMEQEMKQRRAEKALENARNIIEGGIRSGKGIPYPESKLSKETKKEIEKLFNKLPREKQRELDDKAERELGDFEDAVNKGLQGKLNKDNPKTHKEIREENEQIKRAARRSREAKQEMKRKEKELEKIKKENMTEYEKIRSEVSVLIDDLYYRLRKILIPEGYGEKELGWPSGEELDMARAMQAEKDTSQRQKMWTRETVPQKKDYRFSYIVDISGSMEGKKIQETLKGLIVSVEAIDRIENLNLDNLTVHQEITAFSDNVLPSPLKSFRERFSKQTEESLSALPRLVGGGTNTYAATLEALKHLKKNLGETGNFLLTFSDGEPNSDIRDELTKILKNKEGRKGIKVGLIWLGESQSEEDLQKLVREYGYDFGIVMPAVKPSNSKETSFAEKLANLLEDIVKNPAKY